MERHVATLWKDIHVYRKWEMYAPKKRQQKTYSLNFVVVDKKCIEIMMLMTNTFVNDEKHARATAQSKISKTFLGIDFYQSFYSVYGKSLGCELLLMHCYHHEDLSCQSVSKSLKT